MLRDREGTMLALLGILAEVGEPVGTRTATSALRDGHGTTLSESTVSRLLQEMDQRGWTTPMATKGRVLTATGRARHEERVLATRASTTLSSAISVHTVAGLLELMQARKAVESAVAADAAQGCTQRDIDELRALAQQQADELAVAPTGGRSGLLFHRRVAEISKNAMLKVLSGVVLAPQLDHVEYVMDIILGEHHAELSVIDHHRAIVDAIEAGDPVAAEAAMDRHFAEMIGEAERFMVGRNAAVVTRLLEFMESHPPFSRQG